MAKLFRLNQVLGLAIALVYSMDTFASMNLMLRAGHKPNSLPINALESARFTNTLDFSFFAPGHVTIRTRGIFLSDTLINESNSIHVSSLKFKGETFQIGIPLGLTAFRSNKVYGLRTNYERYYYGLMFGQRKKWTFHAHQISPARRSKISVDSSEFEIRSDPYLHLKLTGRIGNHRWHLGQFNHLRGQFKSFYFDTPISLKHIFYANYAYHLKLAKKIKIVLTINRAFSQPDPILLHYITGEKALDYANDEIAVAVVQRI